MNVEELLLDKRIEYRHSGQDCVVLCLNPEHEDSSPSMRIDRVTGVFNCFSCKFRGNIFDHYGLEINHLDIRRERLRKKMVKLVTETVGIDMPKGFTPVDYDWRGYSAETLIKFEAFKHKDFEDRIVFPIRDIRGKIIVFIGRSIDDRNLDKPRYMIYPKKVQLPVYPLHVIKPIHNRVIVVEGITDMLNLYDHGLRNVIPAFGVNGLAKEEKLNLLKMMGVTGIDIVFDGDKAGHDGAKELAEFCVDLDISTRTVKLRDGEDPGKMSLKRVENLKEHLYE